MNIPKTEHKRVKYRNGQTGHLLTTERKDTMFKILTLRNKHDSIIHHNEHGEYLNGGMEHDLDIVEILESKYDDFTKEREINWGQ